MRAIKRAKVAFCAVALAGVLGNPAFAADTASKPAAAATPPAATAAPAMPQAAPANPHSAGQSAAPAAPSRLPPGYGPDGKKKPAAPVKMVDLNNASKDELMTLPSVGAAEADKIIGNRPYISKVDLVTKAGLPQGVYAAVRHRVVVNDMKKPPAKKVEPKQSAVKQ